MLKCICRKVDNGVILQMENEESENSDELQTIQEIAVPAVATVADENLLSELDQQIWSVISFEKRVGKNLKYADAASMLKELVGEKISGLCIVTDDAAEKMSGE